MSDAAPEPRRYPRGSEHGSFKGGVSVNGDGYLQIRAGPCRGKYVHVLVAEARLGRQINPEVEEVHHRNGDRLDPRWENLEVRPVEKHRAFLYGQPWRRKEGRDAT